MLICITYINDIFFSAIDTKFKLNRYLERKEHISNFVLTKSFQNGHEASFGHKGHDPWGRGSAPK
jgi:hypothetical protein